MEMLATIPQISKSEQDVFASFRSGEFVLFPHVVCGCCEGCLSDYGAAKNEVEEVDDPTIGYHETDFP
jgi:hypothetical protein